MAEETVHTTNNALDRIIWLVASRFGTRAREVERFIKFALIGTFGAVVDFTVLNLLEMSLLPPSGDFEQLNVALATGTAFTTAVISNFTLNRYWTFPDSRSRSIGVQLTQFFVVSVVGLLVRLILVSTTYAPLGDLAHNLVDSLDDAETRNQVGSNIAQAISIFLVLFWNYFANRYWTYNDVE